MSGAFLVTTLTIGGAMGLLPGSALGGTDRDPGRLAAAPDNSSPGADSPDTSGPGGGSGGGGGWLTVEPDSDDPSDNSSDNSSDDEALPSKSGHGQRIVFDISDQRVWLVDADNSVERTYLVSGSLHDNLQPGTYQVYSMSRNATSYNSNETMNFMVRFAQGVNAPIGFHDIPANSDGTLAQTRADLGTPQSAGCIRQWKPDAKALWQFSHVGTTVVVNA
jgi:hypothetical protein